MFVKFLIFSAIIGTFSAHNEGGFEAVKEKGVKPALEQALDEGDVSALRGNYGNQ